MVFKGTAQEIDEEILEGLTQPVTETRPLFANISAYNKGIEKAKSKLLAKPKAEKQAANVEKHKPSETILPKQYENSLFPSIKELYRTSTTGFLVSENIGANIIAPKKKITDLINNS